MGKQPRDGFGDSGIGLERHSGQHGHSVFDRTSDRIGGGDQRDRQTGLDDLLSLGQVGEEQQPGRQGMIGGQFAKPAGSASEQGAGVGRDDRRRTNLGADLDRREDGTMGV